MVSAADRPNHIKTAIAICTRRSRWHDLGALEAHPIVSSGFRYQLLILSEAARHLPDAWRKQFGPDINWRGLEDLGNPLRRTYHHTNAGILWAIYEHDLDPLEAAIDRMLTAHGGDDRK
jgi:uncharacterized protein with HEPN domain